MNRNSMPLGQIRVFIRVTRWLDYFSLLCHLKQRKFAKVVTKCCQMLNKPSKACQSLFTCGQSGEISGHFGTLHRLPLRSSKLYLFSHPSGCIFSLPILIKLVKTTLTESVLNCPASIFWCPFLTYLRRPKMFKENS